MIIIQSLNKQKEVNMYAQEAQEKIKPRKKARRHRKKALIFLVTAVVLFGISLLMIFFAGIGDSDTEMLLLIFINFCIFASFIIGLIYLISGFVRKD